MIQPIFAICSIILTLDFQNWIDPSDSKDRNVIMNFVPTR